MKQMKMRPCALILTVVLLAAMLCGCAAPAAKEDDASSSRSSYARLEDSVKRIEKVTDLKPDIVLVLGTGLGDYADSLDVKVSVPFAEIGWPEATAPENAGNLIFADYKGLDLAVMQGHLHYYESCSMEDVILPLRVLHMLGADTVILTNAVGSLNPEFKVGEFMCVADQISSFIPSPLLGENIEELGGRFTGMTDIFNEEMQRTVLQVGQDNSIAVHSGVYMQVTGPQFETPSEVQYYRSLGADTIAMSMADEVIAAAHMGMRICALNCISNMGAGLEEEGFTQETIEESMKGVSQDFEILIDGLLDSLAE